MSHKRRLASILMLLLTAFIWGTAFVAQSVGMNYIGPFTFGSIRFMIGGMVLIPFILFQRKFFPASSSGAATKTKFSSLLFGGLCCGAALAVASSFQQIGIQYTSVGKAGFITTLYIILVPIFGIFLGKKFPKKIWISIFAAVVGLYLLCKTDSLFHLNPGDLLIFICAFCFAIHILIIDYFSPRMDSVVLSCLQFFFAGFFCLIAMFFTENPNLSDIIAGWAPLLYTGVLSCGIAYTLQVVAQKNINPTLASLLMSTESVFSVLAGWVVLHQALSTQEIIGCILMFFAILYANLQGEEIPQKKPLSIEK